MVEITLTAGDIQAVWSRAFAEFDRQGGERGTLTLTEVFAYTLAEVSGIRAQLHEGVLLTPNRERSMEVKLDDTGLTILQKKDGEPDRGVRAKLV